MSFLSTVARAKTYLEEQGRVSLSALKLEFDLDDARLESLVEELVDVQPSMITSKPAIRDHFKTGHSGSRPGL